jgi:hypothetical protein
VQIIKEKPTLLAQMMKDLGISNTSVFDIWLQEEHTYLEGLKKKPMEEMLQMDYYQKLVNLWASG